MRGVGTFFHLCRYLGEKTWRQEKYSKLNNTIIRHIRLHRVKYKQTLRKRGIILCILIKNIEDISF